MNGYRNYGWALATAAFSLLCAGPAFAQAFSSGSTGADGVFSPTTNQNITVRAGGVYHYTSVNIPPNVTVRYFKNTDNAPVVILATGNVTIDGAIVVSGLDGNINATTPALGGQGGPGGFAGGMGGLAGGFNATAGQGPGGGAAALPGIQGLGGVYGAPTSFVGLTPLFGGSGGGGGGVNSAGSSGGGGGGAILIASSTRITVNGAIRSNGGNRGGSFGGGCQNEGGPGSGGAIRLVAPEVAGIGQNSIVQAIAGVASGCTNPGSPGRIRIEASATHAFLGLSDPVPSIVNAPGPVSPGGNPALANVPTLAIASVGGAAVPTNPLANYSVPDITLAAGTPNPVPVVVNVTNTPVGSPTEIKVLLLPRAGGITTVTVPSAGHTGTFASSSATANVTLPAGQVTVVQASAAMTLTGQMASLFPLIDGEPVERVMVAANLGEASTLSLVTKAGKERRLDELPIEDQLRVARAWQAMRETRTE